MPAPEMANGKAVHGPGSEGGVGVIVPMSSGSVQRIVAGQAVTDLSSAVKELVDNALDAGAKTINIRLFNQGLDVVEVSDDGTGVPMSSRPFLAQKHSTSKISSFEAIFDERRCSTLGFRGEALFCLANLSEKLVILTRTKDEELAQRLEFDKNGDLKKDEVQWAPRKVGTTVAVSKLFDALPVRRKDLMKRVKAQKAKVISLVQGYAILCLGVRFNLIDITQTGSSVREETKLSTASATTRVEQTVSSIMGSRFLSGMTRVFVDLTLAIKSEGTWKIEGLVSKAPSLTARDGSFARDAQFFSINGRPVELPKVSRAIGEAWRAMEGTNKKRPACVLCFTLPNKEYDVNLSPDKREVLLTHEDAMCSVVYEALSKLWSSPDDGNFEKNGVHTPEIHLPIPPERQPQIAVASDMSSPEASPGKRRKARRRNAFIHDPSMARLAHEDDDQLMMGSPAGPNGVPSIQGPVAATPCAHVQPAPAQVARTSPQSLPPVQQQTRPSDEERVGWSSVQSRFNHDCHVHQRDEIEALARTQEPRLSVSPITPDEPALEKDAMRLKQSSSKRAPVAPTSTAPEQTRTLTLEDFAFRPSGAAGKTARRVSSSELVENAAVASVAATSTVVGASDDRKRSVTPCTTLDRAESRKRQKADDLSQASVAASDADEDEETVFESQTAGSVVQESEPEKTLVWNSFQGTDAIMKATKEARLSMRQFRKELRDVSKHSRRIVATENGVLVGGIDEADASDDAAERPLEEAGNVVSLSKEEFRHMTVIGQFNLGFILAKCRNNHLWILDQHACDEKYNFERLCATTTIHEQTLISPMPLELSPSEESCILENMTVFEENGFRFAHYPDKPPRHRLALTALPHSGAQEGRKAVQFGKDDVHALCAMLTSEEGYSHDGGTGADGSGMYGNNAVRRHAGVSQSQDNADRVIARLPKAVAMFANRACRGSIMIGTALSHKEMEAVVKRLADVGQPWNCPHGRPTMRHVKDLTEVMMHDEHCASAHVAGPTMAVMTQQEVED